MSKLIERFYSKRFDAFVCMTQNKENVNTRIKKLSSFFTLSEHRIKDWIRKYFYLLRKNNTMERMNTFVKVANFRGGKKAFTNLKLFLAQERAIDIAEALKIERLITIIEKVKNKTLQQGIRDIFSGPNAKKQVVQAINVFEKNILRLRGDNPLKKYFNIWKIEAKGTKNINISSKFQMIQTMKEKNLKNSTILAFERLQHQALITKLRDDMKNLLMQSESDYYKNMIIRNLLDKLILAQKSKIQEAFNSIDHHKENEVQADKLVVLNCTKSLTFWDCKLKGKLKDALFKLKHFKHKSDLEYQKQKWLIENLVHNILTYQLRPTYSNLYNNRNRINKLKRLANIFDKKNKTQKQISLDKMRNRNLKKSQFELFAYYLKNLVIKKRKINQTQAFFNLRGFQPVELDDVSFLTSILYNIFKKPLRNSFQKIKIATGFELDHDTTILKNVILRAERKYGQELASAFSILKTQQIIRELTLIYYIGLNKISDIFNRRKKDALNSIKMEERFQMYRDYYNTFWKEKMNNMESNIYEERINERKSRLFNDFYMSKSVSTIQSVFKNQLRYAFTRIKDEAGMGAENLYSYHDINTVVRNTALLSGIYSMLKKKRLVLLNQAIQKWKDTSKADQSMNSYQRSGFIDSLYKKADLNIHYKRWLYCARLTKILEKCIARRKISFFNELMNKESIVMTRSHYQLDTANLAYNEKLKRKMAMMHLMKLFKTKKHNTFAQICRFVILNRNQTPKVKQEKSTYHRNESGTRLVRSGVRSKSKVRVKRRGRQVMNSDVDSASQKGHSTYQSNVGGGSYNGPSGSRSNYSGSMIGSQAYKTTENISSSKNYLETRTNGYTMRQQRSVQDIVNINSQYVEIKKSHGSFVSIRTSGISKTYARLMNGILQKIINKRIRQAIQIIHEHKTEDMMSANRSKLERVQASYIDMVLNRGAIKILRNHREAQREALFRIFQSLGD